MKPEARNARTAAIRAETLKQLDTIQTDMRKRRADAEEQLGHFSQDAARRRAKFAGDAQSDAMQRIATFETLRRTPSGALIEHLKDAIRSKSLAHAEAVRLEFHSRSDKEAAVGDDFARMFASVLDPEAQAREAELRSIIGAAELAEVLAREFVNGKSLPLDRLTAARIKI